MKLQVIKIRVLQALKRLFLYGTYFIILFLFLAFSFLQIPSIQKSIVNRFTSRFSAISGFTITYDRIYLIWYDHLEINNLKVIDPEKNEMIGAASLKVNFSLTSLLKNNQVNIDAVLLNDGSTNLVKIADSDSTRDFNINLFIAEINKQTAGSGGGGKSPQVNIGEIIIKQSRFTLHDPLKDSLPNAFDYNHITLEIEEAEANNFKVIGDTIELNLNTLIADETNCNLPIKNLSTFYRLSQGGMEFLGLNAQVGQSYLSDTVILRYESLLDLNDFNNKVSLDINLKNVTLHPADLALFTSGVQAIPSPIQLSGNITGKVSRFRYQNMDLAIGNTLLKGRLQLDGLPVLKETFINLDVQEGKIDIRDLGFLFPGNINELLLPLDQFRMTGKFTGFTEDFVANGDFNGAFGRIRSDINLKIDQLQVDQSTFKGNLNLVDFDLGLFLKDTTNFKKVSMSGLVNGKGLTQETLDFILEGRISSIGLLDYNYTNISTHARFAKQLFSGNISVQDPNVNLDVTGTIDIRKNHELVKVKAVLDTLFTEPLGFTKQSVFVRSELDIDTKGLKLDSLFGSIHIKNSEVRVNDKTLHIDSVSVHSFKEGNKRNLQLNSDLLDLSLTGDYYYSSLLNDLQQLSHEFQLNVKNNTEELKTYYQKKAKSSQEYTADFICNIKNINPVLDLFEVDLLLSQEGHLDGSFSNGYTSRLQAYLQTDTISYQGKRFVDNELEFSGSKIRDSTRVLAALSINSMRQEFSKSLITKNLFAEAIWNQDHIDLTMDLDQEGQTNYVRLQSEIDFLNDSTQIKLLSTRTQILDKLWEVNPNNITFVQGKEWNIQNLKFQHENEFISLDGFLSENPEKSIQLVLKDVNLDIINSVSTSTFSGITNGAVEVKNLYNEMTMQNNLFIKDLTVDKFLVGDVSGITQWNSEERLFDINFLIDRLGLRTLTLKGVYNPSRKESPLDVTADLAETNIKLIEPFLRGVFSKIDGTLTGNYEITGSFYQPKVKGEGKIANGKIMIDYLKTLYSFEGILNMTHNQLYNQIIFKDFIIEDIFKNSGYLDGYLTHKNYDKFRINLDANFTNFQVLNTTGKDNSLFYGQAYGTGNLNMFGPLDNMKISATARTSKNTRIFIPVSGGGSTDKSDFISFVSFSDSTKILAAAQEKKRNEDPTGIILDLNLDITPDAYSEIIFDIKAGDIIRGYGYGDIKLQIDTKGEFNMFGLYEFERGFYNFTLYDLINKEFSIAKGSRITWFGDPYAGILDLTAQYKQQTSLGPILPYQDEETLSSPQIKRKYPVDVLLSLDGPMLSPQINFDIVAENLPDNVTLENGTNIQLKFAFDAFKAKLDEQELKRQVFSLIILRRLSAPDAFNTSGSTLSSSVSELLSNQLSYWLTQVDQNLEIDLDLGSLDQEAFNTFQLRLSYSFLNGRLRVTRDGSFNTQYDRSDIANMLGDWTIDYVLTPDGKFKVKMYSRSNYNQLNNSVGTQTAITTGVSLLHTQSFNQVKDLLQTARTKRRKELEENPVETESQINKNGSN